MEADQLPTGVFGVNMCRRQWAPKERGIPLGKIKTPVNSGYYCGREGKHLDSDYILAQTVQTRELVRLGLRTALRRPESCLMTWNEVNDVTVEKFCDSAFVDQEIVSDTFVAQLCRYYLHGRTCNACLRFRQSPIKIRRIEELIHATSVESESRPIIIVERERAPAQMLSLDRGSELRNSSPSRRKTLRSEFLICPRSEGTVALFSPPEIIIYEILMDFALAALEAHRSMHAKVAAILFMIFPSLGAFLRYPQFSRLARL
ncbi:hypothetical protein TNCV_947831 [Trichonephila clavipes]|nr:hypothetical protein TNCV_947831 [Trichonephila clavipes]